jgi:hypothetical protein
VRPAVSAPVWYITPAILEDTYPGVACNHTPVRRGRYSTRRLVDRAECALSLIRQQLRRLAERDMRGATWLEDQDSVRDMTMIWKLASGK